MKRGDIRKHTILGDEVQLSYLGAGTFTTAWKALESDTVYLIGYDMVKESLALWGQEPDNPHVPLLKIIEDRRDGTYVYQSVYYDRLTAAHQTAWKQYRVLKRAWELTLSETRQKPWPSGGLDRCVHFLNRVKPDIPYQLWDALEGMVATASNTGSAILFEFYARNLGVDEAGNLVLRDVLFRWERL